MSEPTERDREKHHARHLMKQMFPKVEWGSDDAWDFQQIILKERAQARAEGAREERGAIAAGVLMIVNKLSPALQQDCALFVSLLTAMLEARGKKGEANVG